MNGFIEFHAKKWRNLQVKVCPLVQFAGILSGAQNIPGAHPEFILRDANGAALERVAIAGWSIDNMNEFLRDKLAND